MDYKNDVKIDENMLDVEWLEQPSKMFTYSLNAAKAERTYDKAKQKNELFIAKLDKKIRDAPDIYGISKISEKAITNVILADKDYSPLQEEVVNTKFIFSVAKAAVTAFSQRKDALENLVKLHGQAYFAGPKMPHNLTEERENRQQKINQKIGEKMKIK